MFILDFLQSSDEKNKNYLIILKNLLDLNHLISFDEKTNKLLN